MLKVKEFPYLTIYWDKESHSVISQWHGGFPGRNLKEGLLAGLDEYIDRRPNAQWIGDMSDVGVIEDEEKAWMDTEWFPKFINAGVRFMAVVQPTSIVAKMAVKDIVSKVRNTQLTIYTCGSLEEALQWMKEQKF